MLRSATTRRALTPSTSRITKVHTIAASLSQSSHVPGSHYNSVRGLEEQDHGVPHPVIKAAPSASKEGKESTVTTTQRMVMDACDEAPPTPLHAHEWQHLRGYGCCEADVAIVDRALQWMDGDTDSAITFLLEGGRDQIAVPD